MRRWYFWVLAPVFLGSAVIFLMMPAPPTVFGQVLVWVLAATMVVATVALAAPRRFLWAAKIVAGVVLAGYVAYAGSEFIDWWNGEPFGWNQPRSRANLFNALQGLMVFGVPSIYLILRGRSGSAIDVLLDVPAESAGYDTPEAAAMSTFSPQHARVVASRSNGRDAFVLLDTGSPGQPYHYGVTCHFRDGRWHEGSSGNGWGWSLTDDQGKTGMVIFSDEVASGIDSVRTELAGDVLEVPVTEGVFLAVWFDRPYDEDDGPRIVAFRQHGNWKPYEGSQWH